MTVLTGHHGIQRHRSTGPRWVPTVWLQQHRRGPVLGRRQALAYEILTFDS